MMPVFFAVMFDNAPGARPQAGLSNGENSLRDTGRKCRDSVYGHFEHTENVSVGGVRSARPYFVATVAEYGAIYAHHGADASVLALIPEYGVRGPCERNALRWKYLPKTVS